MLEAASTVIRWSWVVAEATLLGFLFRRKLLRRYPWFAAFLAVEWLQMVALIELQDGSPLYGKCWALSEILLLLAVAGAAIEITRKILEHYPEIQDFASHSFQIMFWFGCVAATLLGMPFLKSAIWQPTYLVMKVVFWESLTIFFFLGAQALWFNVFPMRMKRNVCLHRWLLALYGGGVPGIWILLMDWQDKQRTAKARINIVMMSLEIFLLAAWCVWFTEEGEELQPNPVKNSPHQPSVVRPTARLT